MYGHIKEWRQNFRVGFECETRMDISKGRPEVKLGVTDYKCGK